VRLFVALTPPAEVVEELRQALAPVQQDGTELRWVPPARWHLTLAFLGEVAEDRLPELTERLARVAARRSPPTLAVSRAGRFGGRVLWMDVTGDREPLQKLAASAAAAARRSKIPVDEERFRPHLTVARSRGRGPADLRPLVQRLAGYAGTPWTADELELVRSHLGAQVRHEVVACWPLSGTR
jgi:2'-5' RNA ligase